MRFIYNDGGRKDANRKGDAGDCVVRAIAIATGKDYVEVYTDLFDKQKVYGSWHNNKAARAAKRDPSPRTGVIKEVYEPYLFDHGFVWEPYMGIGTGCRVHMREDELPEGVIIARLSKHMACVIDGVLHDTYDCTREGTRCVYGAYLKLEDDVFND